MARESGRAPVGRRLCLRLCLRTDYITYPLRLSSLKENGMERSSFFASSSSFLLLFHSYCQHIFQISQVYIIMLYHLRDLYTYFASKFRITFYTSADEPIEYQLSILFISKQLLHYIYLSPALFITSIFLLIKIMNYLSTTDLATAFYWMYLMMLLEVLAP
jgi:hypothetical protein